MERLHRLFSSAIPVLIVSLYPAFVQSQALTDVIVNLHTPQSLELDGTTMYFSEQNGKVSKFDVTQNTPVPVLVSGAFTFATGLEIYGNHLFVGDNVSGVPPYTGKIYRLDLSVPNPAPVQIASGLATPSTLLVHDGFLYFSQVNNNGLISKLNLSVPNALPETVLSSGCQCRIYGIEIVGNDLYYSQMNQFQVPVIYKINIANPTPTPVVVLGPSSGFTGPHRLRKIGDYIYIADILGHTIYKFNPADANPSLEIVVSGVSGAKDCMPYQDDLYIVSSVGNKIVKLGNFELGAAENQPLKAVELYPNPANDNLFVANVDEPFAFAISNMIGQIVIKGEATPGTAIDVSTLSSGTYLFTMDNGDARKLVKR